MEGGVKTIPLTELCAVLLLFMSISISPTLADQSQTIDKISPASVPVPSIDTPLVTYKFGYKQCLKAAKGAEECLTDIYNLIDNGTLTFGSPCCVAIFEIGESCLLKTHPLLIFLLPVIKQLCYILPTDRKIDPGHLGTTSNEISHELPLQPLRLANKLLFGKCLSGIQNVEGCAGEVLEVLKSGNVYSIGIGSACCKAIVEVDYKCWPKLVLEYTLYPHLFKLKDHCAAALHLHLN